MGAVHAEALKRLAGVELIGIQGSTPEKSRAAAERIEAPRAYESWEALIADEEVDTVHITTPNRLHFSQSMDALNAGKHVMCEKPLAMTTDESRELVRLAEASGRVAGVNYNLRFYPLSIEAKERVARGDIGDVRSLVGSYQQDWLLYETDYNWRVLAEEQGALRAVADIGTHWIDLAQFISGEKVTRVFADLRTVYDTRKRPLGEVETFSGKLGAVEATESVPVTTDDMGCLTLRFANGARGMLFVSQVTPGKKNCLRYEIAGSSACLEFDSENPNQIVIGSREEANAILLKDPSLNSPAARRFMDYPGGHSEGYADSFKMCFRAFYQCIAAGGGGMRDFATFQDGHRELELCEAVLKSSEEGRWIDV